uniref:Uncharacterized protein n=1 Tax=Cacopsylla melanoneura TaxID=428564 RepID=A0A8D8LUH2_9HEMI
MICEVQEDLREFLFWSPTSRQFSVSWLPRRPTYHLPVFSFHRAGEVERAAPESEWGEGVEPLGIGRPDLQLLLAEQLVSVAATVCSTPVADATAPCASSVVRV